MLKNPFHPSLPLWKVFQAALSLWLLIVFPVQVYAVSESEIVSKVEPSLVAVQGRESGELFSASGVVIRPQEVVTSCAVVEGRTGLEVSAGETKFPATLALADQEKDLCLLTVAGLPAMPAERGSSGRLAMQESVWAVGLSQGTAAIESGVLTQLRGGQPPFIETTLLGNEQNLGRGVFDEGGRLVGITTVFRDGGRSLHFVAPVEWLDSLQTEPDKGEFNRRVHWIKRAAILEEDLHWQQLYDLSSQWSAEFPDDPAAWHTLGYACIALKRLQEAQAAFQQTIRINSGDIDGWSNLGFVYTDLEQFPEAVRAYREVVRLNAQDVDGWMNLGMSYKASGNPAEAMKVVDTLHRLDPERAEELLRALQGAEPAP